MTYPLRLIFLFSGMLLISTLAAQTEAHIFFNLDESELDGGDRDQLRAFIRSIDRDGGMVLIEGYSDSTGNEAYNMALSEKRALRVESFLNLLGLRDEFIRVTFYGERDELPSHTNDELFAYRRVDVRYFPFPKEGDSAQALLPLESVVVQKLLEPKVQYLSFNNRYRRKVIGKEGAFITLERLVLKSKLQSRYRGEIILELREFSSPLHLLHTGMHTSIGRLHLEVGGMAYILARTPNGEVLRPNRKGEILVGFPTDTLKDGMQVFTTETDRKGNLRWRTDRRGLRDYIELEGGRVYRETRSKRDAFITMDIEDAHTRDPNAVPLYESTIDGFGYLIFARPYTHEETSTLTVEVTNMGIVPPKAIALLYDEAVLLRGVFNDSTQHYVFERMPAGKKALITLIDLSDAAAKQAIAPITISKDSKHLKLELAPFTAKELDEIEGVWERRKPIR